jgi:transposase
MQNQKRAMQLQERRLEAIALLQSGHVQADVAHLLEVSPGAVSQWKKAYDQGGRQALLAKPPPGRTPRLSKKQCATLVRLLKQGPRQHGWTTELWTLPRIAGLIEKEFDVHYDQSSVWHLLKRIGWSCQKPERRAREQDKQAVDGWRQHDWPRLKKRASQRANAGLAR